MIQTRKVVDITDLPEDVKDFAYEYFRDSIQGNGSYISYDVIDFEFYDDQKPSILDKFLLEQGCVAGEEIIILYWW